MQKTLYCVRNGQSEDEANAWYAGHTDKPLTERGVDEAHHIGFRMHVTPVDAIYASPMERTYQTAQVLRKYHPVDLIVDDRLKEWNREGLLSGMTYDQAVRHYPDEIQKLKYYRAHALHGEKYDDFASRILAAFEDIMNAPYKRVVVVTHGNVIGVWLREAHAIMPSVHHIAHPDHIVEIRMNRKHQPQRIHSYFVNRV